MPAITSLGHVIYDASGDPLSGGKLRVYTANTTTLVSLYSDEALTVPLTNPVIANSEGRPSTNGSDECIVYVASGTYDIAELTAANAVLRSWDDFVPSGESGDFTRTVTGNGRVKITGSAGAVLFQAGDADPDNSGGTLTIEGWAGTQLDTLTLDAASVNLGTSAGAGKENGKKLSSVVATPATTFTTAATVDIELVNSPSGVRAWEVEVWDLAPSATMQLQARLSFNSGSSYLSGVSEYNFSTLQYDNATNVFVTSLSIGAAQMDISAPGCTAVANRLGRVKFVIVTVDSGSGHTILDYESSLWNTDGLIAKLVGTASAATGNGRATHLRLIPSSGNLTGKYLVRPLRGYGEA